MRITLIPLFLVLLALSASFAFKPATKLFVPPGTVKVNDTLYYDQAEITNLNWREYEGWTKKNFGASSAEYKNTLPDTLVWHHVLSYCEPYRENYYRHPAYNDYPVVGISYEQAVEYCKWRTERAKSSAKGNPMPQSFYYRLPSKAEWEEVAKVGYDEKVLKIISKKKWKGYQLCNAVRYDSTYTPTGKTYPHADITAPVEAYFPNKLGIYNLFGNVAEMTSESGIAKGGGWNDKFDSLKVENDFPYKEPEAWLGFRCVCIVHWNPG